MAHYIDIERLKDKYMDAFVLGEHIVCQEKLDGSNGAISFDTEGNLHAYSRKTELSPTNNLRGFYEFVLTLDKDIAFAALGSRYILYGEWLVSHTVKYPESRMKKFYVFDVYDKKIGEYMPWDKVKQIAEFIGLTTVPLIYDGPFVSWEHIREFVGTTQMDAEPCGEGVVVKSQDRLDNKSSKTPAYVKIVSEKFSEVHASKPHTIDPEKMAKRAAAEELAKTIVTEPRVRKILLKFIDENIIPTDWDEHNMGDIARVLPRAVYDDCMKEEKETAMQIENFGKICGSITMNFVRSFLN